MRSNNLEPNARLCMASAVIGLHHPVPERRADGLLRGPRRRRRLRAVGQQHGRDAPGALQPHARDQAPASPACASSTSPRAARRPRDYADLYVQFKPGTDLALANGILHLLVARRPDRPAPSSTRTSSSSAASRTSTTIGYGCFDDQAERYTFKDEARDSLARRAARRFLADYTPDKVSEITGVPVAQIRALAEHLRRPRPRHRQPLVHGRQPAHPRHLDEQPDHRPAPHHRQDLPAGRQPVQPDRPAVAPAARRARSGTLTNRLPADMVVTNPEHRAEAETIWELPAGHDPRRCPATTPSTCSGRSSAATSRRCGSRRPTRG